MVHSRGCALAEVGQEMRKQGEGEERGVAEGRGQRSGGGKAMEEG